MATVSQVAAEILTSLPCFGLWVSHRHAESIAALYVQQRPTTTASVLAEALLKLPHLGWDHDDVHDTKMLVMLSLVEHLDGMYFVETLEHDGPPAGA
jgi:imidazoleglycerol phosphate synthase glutamine amidotransferase subunit HisH